MVHKRRKKQHFLCPKCDVQLLRTGSKKYPLFHEDPEEIACRANLTRKKATILLAMQGAFIHQSTWLEEFFCQSHGCLWLLVHSSNAGSLRITLPSAHDWKRTTGTVHPDLPNPSVSEFTHRMSRRATIRNHN
jgi:hypothetical protein